VRVRYRHWTPVHVDFVVDDIDTAVERALAAGAKRESECVEWRGSRCVTFSDPFGHGFCLIEFAGDGYE
jgi:predicted enzyme related to lactoylglutathione lyase